MSKTQGELVELRFYLEAYKRGLIVSKPFGDSARYDFIVDTGEKLVRVQVKSVSVLDTQHRANRYRVLAAHGRDCKQPYTKNEIDLLVAYVIPCDAWYLIPVNKLQSKSLSLFPHRDNNKGLYEQYLNNWAF